MTNNQTIGMSIGTHIIEKARKLDRKVNVFVAEIYSMRTYPQTPEEKSVYKPINDGNLNHMLHELNKAGQYINTAYISIPENAVLDEEFLQFINEMKFPTYQITWIAHPYMENVQKTREWFNKGYDIKTLFEKAINFSGHNLDIIISDFEVLFDTNPLDHPDVIYRFNVCAKGFEDIEHMISSFFPTYYFNDCQKDMLGSMAKKNETWFNCSHIENIAKRNSTHVGISQETVFIPFRLSDKDYQVDEIIDWAVKKGYRIIVTDPNNTAKQVFENLGYDEDFYTVHESLRNKLSMFAFLYENRDNKMLHIPYLSDPTEVLHQSFLEMYTLCPERLMFDWNVDVNEIHNLMNTYCFRETNV